MHSAEHGDPLSALAQAAGSGAPDAIHALLRALAPEVLRVVRSVLGAHHPETDDVLQESLVGFVSALKSFRAQCTVRHFALSIAFRRALRVKRRARDVESWLNQYEELLPNGLALPPDEDLSERRRNMFAQLMREIPKPQAEVLGLRVLVGLSIDEIAAFARVPANTVRSRLRLGKLALRKRIEENPAFLELVETSA